MADDSIEAERVNYLLSEFRSLHEICTTTLERSFEGKRSTTMASSFLFTGDLAGWAKALTPSPEARLYARAEQEYLACLINVAQGQYCNAFKGLRLVLELTIQGAYLSANLVELNEWLRNSLDTNWATLMDPNQGPLSARFADSFYPDLKEHVGSFSTMAGTLYRELSETIHGNIPKHIPLPSSFAFDDDTFELWHRKAATTRIICLFCLAMRYLREMSEDKRSIVENSVIEQLGHIAAIRILFGGPSTI